MLTLHIIHFHPVADADDEDDAADADMDTGATEVDLEELIAGEIMEGDDDAVDIDDDIDSDDNALTIGIETDNGS